MSEHHASGHESADSALHALLREVTVVYPAAREPFREHNVPRGETVGVLKTRVLAAFHLTEGTSPDGATTSYTLYRGKNVLQDLNQTLGDVAGDEQALHLKLVQEIKQG